MRSGGAIIVAPTSTEVLAAMLHHPLATKKTVQVV